MRSAKWQDRLSEEVYIRLAECRTKKSDMVELTKAFYEGKGAAEGFTKEDALVYMLEWVLDWNGGTWDYTDKEFNEWLRKI